MKYETEAIATSLPPGYNKFSDMTYACSVFRSKSRFVFINSLRVSKSSEYEYANYVYWAIPDMGEIKVVKHIPLINVPELQAEQEKKPVQVEQPA